MSSKGKGKVGRVRSSSVPPGGEERPPLRRSASPAAARDRDGEPSGKGKGAKGRNRSSSPATEARKGRGGKDAGRGSEQRSASAPPRDWTLPEGWALEEVSVGAVLDGVVTNCGPSGIFIDVGAERSARLSARLRDQRRFKRGDRVVGLLVEAVDLELRRLSVTVEDIDATLAGSRRPLEEFQEGSVLDGVVADKGPYGVFVNIGGVRDGRLNVGAKIGRTFVRGQLLRNLSIDVLDLELQRMALSLEDPEASAADLTLVSLKNHGVAPAPKAGKGKSKAKAKAKAAAKLEEIVGPPAGSFCDGVVTSVSAKGILVDIGNGLVGSLRVSQELFEEFQKGDRVQGMKVEKVSRTGIILSMEDPELEAQERLEVEEEARLKAAAAKGQSKGKGKPKAKAKGGKA